jgi:hypothetical protein
MKDFFVVKRIIHSAGSDTLYLASNGEFVRNIFKADRYDTYERAKSIAEAIEFVTVSPVDTLYQIEKILVP